ncbi:hypothetical protein HIM_10036 [Hirsutella minnesotensis 3608]|uniref:HTH CENPB-type domain-containing protein n=1 Tax=Hirsutella minnesotensis 3608 TaxID=1043627 RepID=A0A0F7ZS14_9HYPO|nr:hypothetical protein HIM_10036 [Hirsutella minnesotensis 3608]
MNLAVRPGFVTDATNNILRERSGPSGQADFIIGSKWTSRFLKRHGYFKKLQKKLHAERQASEDLTRVTNYFQTLEKVVQEHGIPPDDIWNMDETGFRIGVGKDQLIVTKGKRAHYFGIPENRGQQGAVRLDEAAEGGDEAPGRDDEGDPPARRQELEHQVRRHLEEEVGDEEDADGHLELRRRETQVGLELVQPGVANVYPGRYVNLVPHPRPRRIMGERVADLSRKLQR